MKRMSRGCRLVSSAARSPARWITGPEVARNPTPNSRATICAKVVLPRPGGPKKSTWSSASPRLFAAAMKTRRLSTSGRWPTNSSSAKGRRPISPASRLACSASRRRGARSPLIALSSSGEFLEPGADQRFGGGGGAEPPARRSNGGKRLGAAIAEIDERRDGILLRPLDMRRGRPGRGERGGKAAELVLQLVDDALGEPRADAVGAGERRLVLRQDREAEAIRRQRREDRQSEPRPHPLHRQEAAEPVALGGVEKAVEMDVVLAHMRLDEEPRRGADRRQAAERAGRTEHEIADAADID